MRQAERPGYPSQVQESLSVSGILLGKTMGRTEELARWFETEAGLARRARGAQPDDGPLDDGVDPDLVRGQRAGARLPLRRPCRLGPLGTVIAFTTLQARLFFPIGSLLGVGLEVQTRSRSSTASSSISTSRSTSRRGRAAPRRCRLPRGLLPLRGRLVDALRRPSTCRAARRRRSSARPARQDDCVGYLVARLYDVTRGTRSTATTSASSPSRRSRTRSASSARRRTSSTRAFATTCASRGPMRPTRRSRRRARRRSTS